MVVKRLNCNRTLCVEAMTPSTNQPNSDGWDAWTVEDLVKELRNRMRYFYAQTDGTMRFPSSAEGDMLKMAHVICGKLNS